MDPQHSMIDFHPDYTLASISESAFQQLMKERSGLYFSASTALDVEAGLSDSERARIADRREQFTDLTSTYWAIEHGADVVGWMHLQQTDPDTLTMRNTAIDPAHRGCGIYTALLDVVINHARANGYQRITSTHHASNNAIIIPKLKAGFIITGLQINEKYGAMVALTYYVFEGRLRCAQERIGHVPAR